MQDIVLIITKIYRNLKSCKLVINNMIIHMAQENGMFRYETHEVWVIGC